MILTPAKLEEIGRTLYGREWQSRLADRLERSRQTVIAWSSGATSVPTGLRDRLLELIDEQMTALHELRSEFENSGDFTEV